MCQIYQKNIPLYEHYKDKNNKNLVQMSCTAFIVYTFHLSLHHANLILYRGKFSQNSFVVSIINESNKVEKRVTSSME